MQYNNVNLIKKICLKKNGEIKIDEKNNINFLIFEITYCYYW